MRKREREGEGEKEKVGGRELKWKRKKDIECVTEVQRDGDDKEKECERGR